MSSFSRKSVKIRNLFLNMWLSVIDCPESNHNLQEGVPKMEIDCLFLVIPLELLMHYIIAVRYVLCKRPKLSENE